MKRVTAVVSVVLLAGVLSAQAGLVKIGTISAPGTTTMLTGLDRWQGDLLASKIDYAGGSCLYLIDPATGLIDASACAWDTLPGCSDPPAFACCAAVPAEQPPAVFWAGDECGVLAEYDWGEGLDTLSTWKNLDICCPTGLLYHDGYLYILDVEMQGIYGMNLGDRTLGDAIDVPQRISYPSGLTMYGGHFYVVAQFADSLYELDTSGNLLDVYYLENLNGVVRGATFIGDSLFVATSDTCISVYRFTRDYSAEVPSGEDISVEVVPEELEIGFDAVSEAGSLYVEVMGEQPCPPPGGVRFISDYYEVGTDAVFEYVAEVAILGDTELPSGVDAKDVRVFVRPSGECQAWRDITVEPIQLYYPQRDPRLAVLTRVKSEDDEFSVFVMGEDNRNPRDVVNLKFEYLDNAMTANEGSIPGDTYGAIRQLFTDAYQAFSRYRYPRAATLADRIADMVRDDADIPHTYDPGQGGVNVAGQIIGRAHTLSFSLRLLVYDTQFGEGIATSKEPSVQPVGSVAVGGNPSGASFVINLSPRSSEPVSVDIFSVSGRHIRTLLNGEAIGGSRSLTWDGTSREGERVAAGTYFAVVRQGEAKIVKKLVLQR